MSLYNTQSKSDWLFNTQSRILQADWLSMENNEKATLNINMLYCKEYSGTQYYHLHSSTSTSPLRNSDIICKNQNYQNLAFFMGNVSPRVDDFLPPSSAINAQNHCLHKGINHLSTWPHQILTPKKDVVSLAHPKAFIAQFSHILQLEADQGFALSVLALLTGQCRQVVCMLF